MKTNEKLNDLNGQLLIIQQIGHLKGLQIIDVPNTELFMFARMADGNLEWSGNANVCTKDDMYNFLKGYYYAKLSLM